MLPAFTFTDRARPWLEVGIGDSRIPSTGARWGESRWGQPTATWAGVEPTWLDVSCEVYSMRCEYGRARSNERFVAGAATIEVDNASGWADPNAVDGVATLNMRPGRAIRFGVDHVVLGRLVLWRGFIDELNPLYEREIDTAQLVCVDALGEVNRAKLAGVDPTGAGETAPQRVGRIASAIRWPSSKLLVEASAIPLVAAAMNGQAADLLGRCADSAGGAIYGDRDGNLVYRARDWQTFPPGTPVAATIGNVGATDVCPVSWRLPFARKDIATKAIMGRDADTAIVAEDLDGQAKYGVEPFERVDLWTAGDDDLLALSRRALRVRSSTTAPVVRGVELNADANDGGRSLDLMATADPYAPTHYRCRLVKGGRTVFDAEHLVTGIVHELSADDWSTSLNLDLAAPYASTAGRWGRSLWGRGLWGDVA